MSDKTITISEEKFNYLNKTIESHQKLLHQVKMPDLIRQDLTRDVQIIKSIVNTKTKGV